jgi:hypothetical protein
VTVNNIILKINIFCIKIQDLTVNQKYVFKEFYSSKLIQFLLMGVTACTRYNFISFYYHITWLLTHTCEILQESVQFTFYQSSLWNTPEDGLYD